MLVHTLGLPDSKCDQISEAAPAPARFSALLLDVVASHNWVTLLRTGCLLVPLQSLKICVLSTWSPKTCSFLVRLSEFYFNVTIRKLVPFPTGSRMERWRAVIFFLHYKMPLC